MIFANGIYLWGLLGILLPLAIHLWSRKKVKTIKVGSTKLLQSSEPRQTSGIKPNELLLLMLRILTIVMLVALLAEPAIRKTSEKNAIIYVVEAALLGDDRMASVLDTLPKEAVRILDNGFPKWEDFELQTANEVPFYWQLAQEMQGLSADSIVVFTQGRLGGLRGKRPTIASNTKWVVFEAEDLRNKPLVVFDKATHAERITLSSTSNLLTYAKDTIALPATDVAFNANNDSIAWPATTPKQWLPLEKSESLQVALVGGDTLHEQIRYVEAAFRGVAKYLNRHISIETIGQPEDLGVGEFNAVVSFVAIDSIHAKTAYVIYQPNALAMQLIVDGPRNNVYHLTRLLNSENIVSEQLPEKLLAVLDLNRNLKPKIRLNDTRSVAEHQLQPLLNKEPSRNAATVIPLAPWLLVGLFIIVVLERILARIRKQ